MSHPSSFTRQPFPVETSGSIEVESKPTLTSDLDKVPVDDMQPLDTGFYPRPPTGFGVELEQKQTMTHSNQPMTHSNPPMTHSNPPMTHSNPSMTHYHDSLGQPMRIEDDVVRIEEEVVKQEQDYSPNPRVSIGYAHHHHHHHHHNNQQQHGNCPQQQAATMAQCVSDECLRRQIDEFKQEEFTPSPVQAQSQQEFNNVASLPCTYSTQHSPISTQAQQQQATAGANASNSCSSFPITSCQSNPITQSSQQIIIINQNPSQMVESVDPTQVNTQVVSCSNNKVTMSSGADLLQQQDQPQQQQQQQQQSPLQQPPPQQQQHHNQQVQPVYERQPPPQSVQDVWPQQSQQQQQTQIIQQPASVHQPPLVHNNNNFFGDATNDAGTSGPVPFQQLSPGGNSNSFQQQAAPINQMVSQPQPGLLLQDNSQQQFQQQATNLQQQQHQQQPTNIHPTNCMQLASSNQLTNQLVQPVQAVVTGSGTFITNLTENNFKNEQNQVQVDGKGIIESLSPRGPREHLAGTRDLVEHVAKQESSPFDIGIGQNGETAGLPDLAEFRHIPPKIENNPVETPVASQIEFTTGSHSITGSNAWEHSIGHPLGDQDVKMRDMSNVDAVITQITPTNVNPASSCLQQQQQQAVAKDVQNGTRELTEEELRKLIRENPDISIRTTVEPSRVCVIPRE